MNDDRSPDCCAPEADPRVARRFDARYADWTDDELPEMVDVSARLLDGLRDATLRRPTVLEIGCGTGAVSVALLEMGARRVRGVDVSPASIDLARRRATAAKVADRSDFEVAGGADVRGEPFDWVVLDRVICCDRHVDRLLDAAFGVASERVALSVPESRGLNGLVNRVLWRAENVLDFFSGGCYGYVHDLRRIERRLASAGFAASSVARVGLWHVGIYDRTAAPGTR